MSTKHKANKSKGTIKYFFRNDVIFKNSFNTEQSLKKLIKCGLGIIANKVVLLDKELPISSVDEKRKILDLLAFTDKGVVSIEVNNDFRSETCLRNFLCYCKLLSMSLEKAQNYNQIDRHVQLNLTWNADKHFPFLDTKNMPVIRQFVKEDSTNTVMYENVFQIVTINMDYYEKMNYNSAISEMDKFFKFLSATTEEELTMYAGGDKFMMDLEAKVKELLADPNLVNKITIPDDAEKWKNTYIHHGVEKGKLDAAQNMLKEGLPIDLIIRCTGLPKYQVEQLKAL